MFCKFVLLSHPENERRLLMIGILEGIQQMSPEIAGEEMHLAAEELVKHDPYGLVMAVMSIGIVITILSLIYLVYKSLGKFYASYLERKKRKHQEANNDQPQKTGASTEMSGEVNAAIAMALFLYQKELHDTENTVITLKKVAHKYSPWSSKIYGLKKYPR